MVVVATDAHEVVDAIRAAGGEAVMTRPDHASGSDRVFEAVNRVDPRGAADFIVNLQGDLPTLEPRLVRDCLEPLLSPGPDIATLAAEIVEPEERTNPNVVKVVGTPLPPRRLRALYFTRATAPSGDGPLYHHIGIYAYRRAGARALRRACRPRRWRSARSSSSCARSRPACASTSRSLTRFRSVSILRPISSAPAASSSWPTSPRHSGHVQAMRLAVTLTAA